MKNAVLTSALLFITIVSSVAQLAERAEDISPLMISERVPSVKITSISGETESLTDIVKQKRSIVLF